MKMLILALTLIGSSFANASVYLCKAGQTRESQNLVVFDRVNSQFSIFSKAGSLDSWTLNYGDVVMAYPMQPGDEYVAYAVAEDNSPVNWDQLAPETCRVVKKSTLHIKFRETEGNQITGRIQWLPKVIANPSKTLEECPLPRPYVLPEVDFTCSKI